jgi:hypothetical protein
LKADQIESSGTSGAQWALEFVDPLLGHRPGAAGVEKVVDAMAGCGMWVLLVAAVAGHHVTQQPVAAVVDHQAAAYPLIRKIAAEGLSVRLCCCWVPALARISLLCIGADKPAVLAGIHHRPAYSCSWIRDAAAATAAGCTCPSTFD